MAGSVKGTWDGKDIELNDAATETTLLKILAALNKTGGAGGAGGGGSGNAKEAAKEILNLSENSKDASESLEDLEEESNNLADSFKNAAKATYDSLWGLTEELLIGGDSLSDFSQHFANLANEIPIIGGLLGGALQTVTGLLDSQIENYRELSRAGVVFGSSLFDAQKAAAQTNLTLDQFTSVITSNSAAMAAIGGTAGQGAKVFADVSQIMQRDFGTQFQALGIQATEQAEMTASYLETLARTGRLQRMTSEQQAASTGRYLMQVDKLSKATGAQREEIEAAMQQAAQDDRLQTILAGMGETAASEMTATLAYIKQTLGPEAESAFIDVIATGGNPLSEMGESIMLNNSELGNMMVAMSQGKATLNDFQSQMSANQERLQNSSEAHKRTISTMNALGDTTFAFDNLLFRAGNRAGSMAAAQQQQQDQINKGSEGLLGFAASLTNLRNQIIGKLIDSGVFAKLEEVFNKVVTYFTEGGGFDAIIKALDGFSVWFSNFFDEMSAAEDPMQFIIDKIKSWWKDIDIKGMIWDAIFGGSSSSSSDSPSTTSGGAAGMDGPGSDNLPSTGGSSSSSADTGGFFDGLSDKLGTFGTILGAGGAVFLAVKGFQALLAGFGTGPVAIGAAVFTAMLIGTGGAIALAGQGISAAGDGVEKVAAGVERLAAVRGAANFANIAESLGKLGPALISLTAGGVMDSITSFFGAESPFDKLVDGINRFGSVDATAITAMSSAGLALTSFTGLADGLDNAKVEDYAEAIETLAEAMKELNEQLAVTNRGALGGGTGVSAGSLLRNGQMGGGSGSGSSDQLERLNTTMQQVLTAINDTSRREVTAITGLGNSVY